MATVAMAATATATATVDLLLVAAVITMMGMGCHRITSTTSIRTVTTNIIIILIHIHIHIHRQVWDSTRHQLNTAHTIMDTVAMVMAVVVEGTSLQDQIITLLSTGMEEPWGWGIIILLAEWLHR